ncbi:hypothetical protein CR513_49709, partial [Mucuna pruriens]
MNCYIINKLLIHGCKIYSFNEKPKLLKDHKRKRWNKEGFGLVGELNNLDDTATGDDTAAGRELSIIEVECHQSLNLEEWKQLRLKDNLYIRKLKSTCVRARRRQNQIVTLRVGVNWIEGAQCDRPILEGTHFRQVSYEDNLMLIAPFSLEEIQEAVWSCEGNKSPRLDGFNFHFFKSC